MSKIKPIILGGFFLFLFNSCSPATPEIKFDSASWKTDLNGCKGQRLKLQNQLEDIRLELPGLHERDIRKLFGKPDLEELMERSNKIYIYFLTPGPKCQGKSPDTSKTALTVRFDALGNVREANLIEE